MKLIAFALDFDGTIADDRGLDVDVQSALVDARKAGFIVALVTGRILSDLAQHLRHFELFDAVVAENGAVLHFPRTGRSTLLAPPPEPRCLAELALRGIPFQAGECVIELDAIHAAGALSVVRGLELPLILAFNRGRLMLLPQAVSKSTGLRAAARALRLSLHNALGVGDAENDHDLLHACEHGVAVSWGSLALQRAADEVLEGGGPGAVAGLLRRSIEAGRLPLPRSPRHRLPLGVRASGAPLSLGMLGRNVVIAGDAQSGKSWLAGLLCEQLVLQRYSVCVIDPEGDYESLETLPGVMVLSADGEPPRLHSVERALRFSDVSVVVNLASLSLERKREYVPSLLARLASVRSRTGLPHRIVLDEAHYFLRDLDAEALLDGELMGYTLVSFRVSELDPRVLASAEAVLVTHESDAVEAEALRSLFGEHYPPEEWSSLLASLDLDEAALLPGAPESGAGVVRFRLARRLTAHVRHQHKYLAVPVDAESAFVFCRDGQSTGHRARTLQELIDILSAAPERVFDGHLGRHDFSRWIRAVFSDRALADEVARVESAWKQGALARPHDQIVRAIVERYAAGAAVPIAAGTEFHSIPARRDG